MEDDSQESLFFYEQRSPTRRFKRVRKEPEELPQALRYFKYANLNPKIAAFLGKQDPRNVAKRGKGPGTVQDETDAANIDLQPVVADTAMNESLGILGGLDNGLSQEARSLLPEIGQSGVALVKMRAVNGSAGVSRMSFNETDDPQRYQFEETTFAAPNILRELSDTLVRYDSAFTEYIRRSKTHENSGETTKKQPADILPSQLKNMLCQEWPELTSDVVYTPRIWQSQAYKSGYKYASTLASGGRQLTATTTVDREPGVKGDLKGMVDLLDVKPTKIVGIDDVLMHVGHKKKGKVPEKEGGRLIKTDDRVARHGGNATLSFNLSSKRAFDEGWIVNSSPDPDLEQTNLLEWATGRLQTLMKRKEDEDEHAKKMGCDKHTVMRYYGDSRRDTLMKLYRKSNENEALETRKSNAVPKIPQLTKIDSTQRERFMVQLPDGTTTLFYPGENSEVAVMASAVPDRPGELYVNCYDNDEERTCLAVFTPYGKSCCYHKNGVPALVLSEIGGVLKSEEGRVVKKWTWPKYGKMKESIVFQLSKEMYVRILGRENVTLHFSCSRETHKLNVGAFPGAQPPTNLAADALGTLQAGLRYSSKSALEYTVPRSVRDERPKVNRARRHMCGVRKQVKKFSEIDELKKSFDSPDRFEFESQADRELQRLQHKSRLLVDDWMEHYRVAVGISSPVLKKMMDKSTVITARRNVRSAIERIGNSAMEDVTQELKLGSALFQSFRSPSAPPKHMVTAQKTKLSESTEAGTRAIESDNKTAGFGAAHVRIDEAPKELNIASTGKGAAIRLFKSASTAESRARQGRSTGPGAQRQLHSSIFTSSAYQPLTSGQESKPHDKVWPCATEACPLVTRLRLLHPNSNKTYVCKCSKHRVPFISDIEFDIFMREVVPQTQLIVVSVMNSLHKDANPYSEMLEKIYISKNRNRTKPCLQCRHDQYRILCYDLARAHYGTKRSGPLQLERHCVVPGMTLMYCGGKLLFADHIFNGYGNARKDFKKQIFKSQHDFLMEHYLPDDFRFSPSRGKSGARAAWGGEIGGTGVHGKGKPGLLPGHQAVAAANAATVLKSRNHAIARYAKSASYSSSSLSDLSTIASHFKNARKSKFDSAREFVQFSLSAKVYTQSVPQASSNNGLTATENKSTISPGGNTAVAQLHNFLMMQAVK